MAVEKVSNGLADAPITGKLALFVAEYQKDHNGAQAAIRAGYAPGSAKVTASRFLSRANVKAAIANQTEQRIAQVTHETGITLERTIRELARLAYFDPRRLFDSAGRPLSITELDDDTAAVIAGLDVMEEFEGSGADRVFKGYVKKWKLADKKGALDMLMKYQGGYAKDNETKAEATERPLINITDAARQIALAMHIGLQRAQQEAKAQTLPMVHEVPASQAHS